MIIEPSVLLVHTYQCGWKFPVSWLLRCVCVIISSPPVWAHVRWQYDPEPLPVVRPSALTSPWPAPAPLHAACHSSPLEGERKFPWLTTGAISKIRGLTVFGADWAHLVHCLLLCVDYGSQWLVGQREHILVSYMQPYVQYVCKSCRHLDMGGTTYVKMTAESRLQRTNIPLHICVHDHNDLMCPWMHRHSTVSVSVRRFQQTNTS